MNETIVKINELHLQLDILREKLTIALQGLNAIKDIEVKGIAHKTLEEIGRLDSDDNNEK